MRNPPRARTGHTWRIIGRSAIHRPWLPRTWEELPPTWTLHVWCRDCHIHTNYAFQWSGGSWVRVDMKIEGTIGEPCDPLWRWSERT